MIRLSFTLLATLLGLAAASAGPASAAPAAAARYHTVDVDGVRVFYREAGDPDAPVVLLLHGYPTSSHMSGALRAFTIALTAFLTVVDLFATQAILPALTSAYGVTPAAMGFAVNASTIGMSR